MADITDAINMACGRLTLTQNTPVTTSDVTAATYVYYEPYVGNRIALYSTSGVWRKYYWNIGMVRVAVPATTVTPFDIFAYPSGDTITLATTNWASDTARATSLAVVDGVYVSGSNYTGRYLGTGRTTSSSGQTEDSYGGAHQSGGKRFLWNMYNRVLRHAAVVDTTTSYVYNTATWRQTNGATGNKVEVVQGVTGDTVVAFARNYASHATAGLNAAVGVGVDSTTTNIAALHGGNTGAGTGAFAVYGRYSGILSAGYHALNWLEIANGTATWTWYPYGTPFAAGMQVEVWA